MTLSSVNAVTQVFAEIKALIPYTDFLFGNEEEVKQLGVNLGWDCSLEETCTKLVTFEKVNQARTRVVICTQGKNPTLVATAEKLNII